jgi:hypothetical protein
MSESESDRPLRSRPSRKVKSEAGPHTQKKSGMSRTDPRSSVYSQVSDHWCALVSDAIVFVYGVSIPEDRLLHESVTGKLDKASVTDAFNWAQAVVVWKTNQSDEAVWPGHITPALWPLFWEVAFRLDRERTMTAIGYALTAFAYRDYDIGKDQKARAASERMRHGPAN